MKSSPKKFRKGTRDGSAYFGLRMRAPRRTHAEAKVRRSIPGSFPKLFLGEFFIKIWLSLCQIPHLDAFGLLFVQIPDNSTQGKVRQAVGLVPGALSSISIIRGPTGPSELLKSIGASETPKTHSGHRIF